MLRGLLIRQFLLAADLLLAILVLAAAYLAVARLFDSQAPSQAVAVPKGTTEEVKNIFRDPVDRTAYASIISVGLYGASASVEKVVQEQNASKEPDVIETSLPLRLFGTAAASAKDPLGSAVIESSATGAPLVETYFLGQKVIRNVVLEEIHLTEVILYNPDDNTREVLRSEGAMTAQETAAAATNVAAAEGPGAPPGARGGTAGAGERLAMASGGSAASKLQQAGASAAGKPGATKRVDLNKNEVAQAISKLNLAQAYAELSPSMATDASGNPIGLTANNISNFPLAQQFGFQNGDIITKINGVDIDSEQRAFEVVNRFQNSTTHYVTVQRNGQTVQLEFRLQ